MRILDENPRFEYFYLLLDLFLKSSDNYMRNMHLKTRPQTVDGFIDSLIKSID